MDNLKSEWQRTGATLSDKTARKEFRLAQDEIIPRSERGISIIEGLDVW